MNVLLRSDSSPDVGVSAVQWEYMDLEKLDQHIRTLQAARAWLKRQQQEKKKVAT